MEALIRSPVCGCGYVPGETPLPPREEPQDEIEKHLDNYISILIGPAVKEAIAARIFALADAEPDTTGRLRSLKAILDDECTSSASLVDVLDDAATNELSRALRGRVRIEKRSLNSLVSQLAGRRLIPQQIRKLVEQWVAETADNTVIAVQEDPVSDGEGTAMLSWWTMLHRRIFTGDSTPEFAKLETTLERNYPATDLRDKYLKLYRLYIILAKKPERRHFSPVSNHRIFIDRLPSFTLSAVSL